MSPTPLLLTLIFQDENQPRMTHSAHSIDEICNQASIWRRQFAAIKYFTLRNDDMSTSYYNVDGKHLFTVPKLSN